MVKLIKFYLEFKRERKVVIARHAVEYPDSFKPSVKMIWLCYKSGYTGSDTASILY